MVKNGFEATVGAWAAQLSANEKTPATREKYVRAVRAFAAWLGARPAGRAELLLYKAYIERRYTPAGVNGILAALHSYFAFCGKAAWRVKTVKTGRRLFAAAGRELGKAEYQSLLTAAAKKGNTRLWLLLQTMCATGVRVSEVAYITVECLAAGCVTVHNKGKYRTVFLPRQLCRSLQGYCKKRGITAGPVFVTRGGKPLDRSNIHHEMKKLAPAAGVEKAKVFPHNLRHLFARTHYAAHKDIGKLADLLGHSNVNTTRIYLMESGETHRRQIEHLGLLVC